MFLSASRFLCARRSVFVFFLGVLHGGELHSGGVWDEVGWCVLIGTWSFIERRYPSRPGAFCKIVTIQEEICLKVLFPRVIHHANVHTDA